MTYPNLLKLSVFVLITTFISCKNEPATIKVGVYGPFSGGSAPMGVSMKNGI